MSSYNFASGTVSMVKFSNGGNEMFSDTLKGKGKSEVMLAFGSTNVGPQ